MTVRCFLSERSEWTLDLAAQRYRRVPRDGDPTFHPYGTAYRQLDWPQFADFKVMTRAECSEDSAGWPANRRSTVMKADDLYLLVNEPGGYWIETIVREVFP